MKYHPVKIQTDRQTDSEPVKIHIDDLVDVKELGYNGFMVDDHTQCIQARSEGTYKGKGIYLSHHYNWVLTKDEFNQIVLIPYKKN